VSVTTADDPHAPTVGDRETCNVEAEDRARRPTQQSARVECVTSPGAVAFRSLSATAETVASLRVVAFCSLLATVECATSPWAIGSWGGL
jgi:hypothetical protein